MVLVHLSKMPNGISRRGFLNALGLSSGTTAVFHAMGAMGLLNSSSAQAADFRAAWQVRPSCPDLAKGPRVVILGAGIAGLTTAFELQQAGFSCTVLDARELPGGRCETLRRGSIIDEVGFSQTCEFDGEPELYFNSGPSRIPHHHERLLGYCRDFSIALEPFINDNRAASFHHQVAFAGEPVTGRAVHAAVRGNMAELLAKAISRHALDDELDFEDRLALLEMLKSWGALDADFVFRSTTRAGIVPDSGGLTPAEPLPAIDFREFLRSDFGQFKMHFGETYKQSATMLQPVGGMDKIARAFAERVGCRLFLGHEVTAIRRQGSGVRIEFEHQGSIASIDADVAIVTIPASVLRDIPNDFSSTVQAAILNLQFATATKLAFQSERFWEREHSIYGGISWTDQDIQQVWYPSTGFGRDQGIMLGSYIFDGPASVHFSGLTPAQRIELVLDQAQQLHPEIRSEVSRGVSRAWVKTPYSLGSWSVSEPPAALMQPDGPFIFAGDYLTYLSGWQEGAIVSAHSALLQFQDRLTGELLLSG